MGTTSTRLLEGSFLASKGHYQGSTRVLYGQGYSKGTKQGTIGRM